MLSSRFGSLCFHFLLFRLDNHNDIIRIIERIKNKMMSSCPPNENARVFSMGFIYWFESHLPHHRLKIIGHRSCDDEVEFGVGVLDAELGGVEG